MQFERQKLRSTNAVRKTKTSIYKCSSKDKNFDLLMQFERQKLRSTNAVRKTKTSIHYCRSKDKNFDLLLQFKKQQLLSTNAKNSKNKKFTASEQLYEKFIICSNFIAIHEQYMQRQKYHGTKNLVVVYHLLPTIHAFFSYKKPVLDFQKS